jgi:hypothetical protein
VFRDDFSPAWTYTPGENNLIQQVFGDIAGLPSGGSVAGGFNRTGPSMAHSHRGFLERYDATGSQAWSDVFPDEGSAPQNGSACFVASSSDGFAALCYERLAADNVTVRKFSEDGTLEFSRDLEADPAYLFSQSEGSGPWPRRPALAVGEGGGLAIGLPVGEGFEDPDASELFVYDASGALAWSDSFSGSGSLWYRGAAVLEDGGTVFVGDTASEDGSGGQDAIIQRFGPTGELLWNDVRNGTADGDDRLIEVEVDTRGDIIVFGDVVETDTGRDLVLRKYRP